MTKDLTKENVEDLFKEVSKGESPEFVSTIASNNMPELTKEIRYYCDRMNLQDEDCEYFINLMQAVRKEAIEEMIELSDKCEAGKSTELEEWKAFKHFRNTMRDSISKE